MSPSAAHARFAALLVLLLAGAVLFNVPSGRPDAGPARYANLGEMPLHEREEGGRAYEARERMDWEVRRLRDPATGNIPLDIRARELRHAAALPVRPEGLGKNAATWAPRGPYNVGGRTRGLAFDLGYDGTTNRKLLAGSVSGGVFVSEDDGATWRLTSALNEFASVTSLAQDPNNRNVWYHGTGEFSNSFRGVFYLGQGVFKSTDGGNTWARLPGLNPNNRFVSFDDPFDIVWNVVVHPQNSVVLVAHINGISRSTDGGQTWQYTLSPGQNASTVFYTDVALSADGTVYATMSKNGGNHDAHGVYRSTDRGQTWSQIRPPGLVADPYRMVIATAPSDARVLYLLVQANAQGAKAADHQLFRYNGGTWADLTATLPNVTASDGQGNPPIADIAQLNSQGGYDLVVKVRPDNPNVVWIGGTNLYRSTNGGTAWEQVGGYESPYRIALYKNHHPDQHALAFAPGNPNTLLSGHDGGLSKTTSAGQSPQQWASLNNGYVTSQFYAIALDPKGTGALLVGGTQDNGTWLTEQASASQPWTEMLSGDGAFAAVEPGGQTLYVSSQNANVIRVRAGVQNAYSLVRPSTLPNPPFIAPFVLDPNDARVMYLSTGNAVSRNSNLNAIPDGNFQPTDQNWTQLTNSAVGTAQTHQVTALAVSKVPANRLVFAVSDFQTQTKVIRVDDPAGNGAGTDITPAFGAQNPPNVSCVALNPQNADEMIVVVSNYGVTSLWHTTNGGQSWTDVEGNLGGADGPSIRWAAIQPLGGQKVVALATSTGVYTTSSLAGANTTWTREGDETIGRVVTDMVVTRDDGTIVAATHGRGVFSARLSGGGAQAVATTSRSRIDLGVVPGTSRSTTLDVRNTGGAPLSFTAQASCLQPTGGSGAAAGHMSALVFAPRTLRPRGSADGPAARAAGYAPGASSSGKAGSQPNTRLILDDGNETPDDFIGDPENGLFTWYNGFDVIGSEFTFEGAEFFMRTEGNLQNAVTVTLYDGQGTEMAAGTINVAASGQNGQWYSITSDPIKFAAGTRFFVEVTAPFGIQFPAGADRNAKVPGKSYYYDWDTFKYLPLSTVTGFTNGAWLIRAVGTQQGTPQNQPPQAVARVSKQQATVGETITFDASGSNDPDGQVVSYLWTFGDGQTSSQAVASHAYAAAGTYTLRLEVTDDRGAKGSVSGQITVTGGASTCPLTVTPASGTVAAGASQTLTVTFDASSTPSGTYAGQITVGGNGGTVTVPVAITVDVRVGAEDEAPGGEAFALEPNRPNPFSTATDIPVVLREPAPVRVTIYDALGRRVAVLADGPRGAGRHVLRWDGRDDSGVEAASGLYFVRLESGDRAVALGRRILKAR